MELNIRSEASVVIIELKGRFDSNGAEEFSRFCQPLLGGDARQVVIDFSKVDLITSHALCVILVFLKKLRSAKGDLFFCHVSPSVRDVLRMAGFVNFIKVFPTLEDAIKVAA